MNPVKKGTNILTSKPFAFALYSKYRTEYCDHCFRSGKLQKCCGCDYVYYCDKNCQRDAWKSIHKFECKRLKKFFPMILSNLARFLARIFITLNEKKKGKNEREYYWGNSSRTFQDLMSHKEEIRKDEQKMTALGFLFDELKIFFGLEYFSSITDFDRFLEIYGKASINSFGINNIDLVDCGKGLYLAASSIDHSCQPNAHAVSDGTTLIIRTLKDFPNFEFSQLRVSYVDPLQTADERNELLKERYYFVCDCPSCIKPELKYTAAACQNSSCTNPCKATDKQCSACGHEFPPDFANIYAKVDKFLIENKEALQNNLDWDLVQKCLKKQEGILHPINVHYIATLKLAFEVAHGLNYWKSAELFGIRAIEGYLEYYSKYSSEVGFLYLRLAPTQMYLGKIHEAAISADRAKSIMTVVYGEENSAFKNLLNPLLPLIQMKK